MSPDVAAQEAGKISKSKGSSAFSEMLKQFDPETIRFFLLSSHYRRPIDFSNERIEEVAKGLETFYRFFKRFEKIAATNFYSLSVATNRKDGDATASQTPLCKQVADYRTKYLESMDDDFNTGGAIGVLFDLLRLLNKYIDDNKLEAAKGEVGPLVHGATMLREIALTLGLFQKPPQEKESAGSNELVAKLMNLLIELRTNAKKAKDFATADQIRNGLKDCGVTLEDRPGGTEWSVVR